MYLMIDNYDSFTYNLYALFAECGVDVKIIKNNEYISADDYEAIILSPGPSSPENSGTTLQYLKEYYGKKPIFGVCLGMQSIAYSLGYDIIQAQTIKHGKIDVIEADNTSVLFQGLPETFDVVRYHSLAVDIPKSLITAKSKNDSVVMAMEDVDQKIFGVQFHPESIKSHHGRRIIMNFINFVQDRRKDMNDLVKKINSGETIEYEESLQLFDAMANGELAESQIASTLMALRHRGETSDELAALVATLDRYKKRLMVDAEDTVDTCGTGGDGKSTVNVSTAVSIIMASLGYNVVKHGNRAQSGIVGSADILESLGLDLEYKDTSPENFFKENNFIFMMAPYYHPALKGIGKVRRELGVPTIFNYVGPLVNPASPDYQVIGISNREKLQFMSEALIKLKRDNVILYSSYDGYDEVSSKEKTECLILKNGKVETMIIDPSDFFKISEMPIVEDDKDAMDLFMKGLLGEDEIVANIFAINTALAIYNCKGTEMKEAFKIAKNEITSGRAMDKLRSLTA